MIECPIYLIDPSNLSDTPSTPAPDTKCGGCNCGYLQYESLLPYLPELNDKLREDKEKYNDLELKLRQQIIEVSRLFDMEAGVYPGYFSKAHCTTTKVFTTDGTKYMKVPEYVTGTLEVRTIDDYLLDSNSYDYRDQHLVYLPCSKHITCGCNAGCKRKKSINPRPWPSTCYKLTAKWGRECADYAVQMAIRDYLIEAYRMTDPIKVLASGISVQRNFNLPYSWSSYVSKFNKRQHFFSQYAIA